MALYLLTASDQTFGGGIRGFVGRGAGLAIYAGGTDPVTLDNGPEMLDICRDSLARLNM